MKILCEAQSFSPVGRFIFLRRIHNWMKIGQLYKKINWHSFDKKYPTLKEMEITEDVIAAIDKWASSETRYGILATYIPELKKVNPDLTAIAIGDLCGNKIIVGSGSKIKISAQSVIKPFLYLYALEKGVSPGVISGFEATALSFKSDRILRPDLELKTAEHPMNNAGGISSAGEIDNFNDFLKFMGKLTNNPNLKILKNVYESEMKTNHNNRAISNRFVASGRFKDSKHGLKALSNYTKACSLGLRVSDLLTACLVLSSGGYAAKNKKIVNRNNAVRVMTAMNTFGMYEESGEITLLVAGARANTTKSSVGGLIININPQVGAFVTYNPLLNSRGNSVYGIHAMIPLNSLMAKSRSLRLSVNQIKEHLEDYNFEESKKIHEEILELKGENPRIYRLDKKMLGALETNYKNKIKAIRKIQARQ